MQTLTENLLSLRKFAEMGLGIYSDNEKIDIFDPISEELFITGVYKRPYWIIKLEILKDNKYDKTSHKIVNRRVIANLAEKISGARKYITRSVTAKEKTQINFETDKIPKESEKSVQENNIGENIGENIGVNIEIHDEILNSGGRDDKGENEKDINRKTYEHSNFDVTIWDRKLSNIDELPIVEIPNSESPFLENYKKFAENNKAML